MDEFDTQELIHDWNEDEDLPDYELKLNDETLRDGLQSPSIANPKISDKIEILHYMEALGIYSADIGLPGAGPQAYNDVLALAGEIAKSKLKIQPNCAARTIKNDIIPIAEISQKTGLKIQAALFIFSSPIRQLAENWDVEKMLKVSEEAVKFALKQDLSVMYVTEDTTRAFPNTIERLYKTAIECGAERICIADTVGHSTPSGVRRLLAFIKDVVAKTGENVALDWHGHNDRGLSLINSIEAFFGGADRIHGCALGIGERVGNASIDMLMVNFKLLGIIDQDLTKLSDYCRAVSKACKAPIFDNYPVLGKDAFRTATGVHADAIIKAYAKGDTWLANRIYSGVPADEFGMEQVIEVGPMSGKSNVEYWLKQRQIPATEELVDKIFQEAKKVKTILPEKHIMEMVRKQGTS